MRTIYLPIANELHDELHVYAVDEPGAGGASHQYDVATRGGVALTVHFQNGPVKEAGVNGVSNEALLAIVVDRLRGFQSGPFACRENAVALTNVEQALLWLAARTAARVVRGVEGTSQL